MSKPLPAVRRIVTGHNSQGRSLIENDGPSPSMLSVAERPGYAVTNIWRTGAAPCDVSAQDDIAGHSGVMPPRHGTVLRVIDIPPEPDDPKVLSEMLHATFRTLYPDAEHTRDEAAHQGMHRTLSVDYAIILQGSITAIMDEGETVMNAGDILIQRGTNHAWSNKSGGICRIAFVLIDGRAGE